MAYINGSYILFSPQIKLTSGGIIPIGSLEITENGTYPVADKAEVVVNVEGGGTSGKPIEISTEAEMNTQLAMSNVGTIYKYMGESTDIYEKGALYIVEAVSE